MADKKDKPKFKRRALGRSLSKRRLGRRKDKDQENEEEEKEEQESEESSDDSSSDSSSDDAGGDDPTAPLPITPSPIASPGEAPPSPTFDEKMVTFRAGASRFTREFGEFLVSLGRSATDSGKRFGQEVVRPISNALFEAAVAIGLLALTVAFGFYLGRTLHPFLRQPAVEARTVNVTPPRGRGHPFPAQQSSRQLPRTGPSESARTALTAFLEAVNRGDHQTAYSKLSEAWQRELPYPTFSRGYARTRNLRYSLKDAIPLGVDRVQLNISVEVREGEAIRNYEGTYIAIKTPRGWKLDSGLLR